MTEKISTNYTLVNEYISFSLSSLENTWQLVDRVSGVIWGNAPEGRSWIAVVSGNSRNPLKLSSVNTLNGLIKCSFIDESGIENGLRLVFRLVEAVLQVYLLPGDCPGLSVELFTSGLEASAKEDGEALVPVRMGLLLPAKGTLPFNLRFGTYEYEGVHMAMAALLKSGSALMATWHDPYVTMKLSRQVDDEPYIGMSFELTKTAQSIQLHCLGKRASTKSNGLRSVAIAYRMRAEELGYRPQSRLITGTNSQQRERLNGACNFKLWTALARQVDKDLVEQSVEVKWTFEEVALIAEHLQRDLKLEDVLFHLGGWSRYGYDCKHPDIMPANPECGGDQGLADCAKRVQACGYLFCLHDNYQDMYRDAPSWDEKWIQKNPDGSPKLGGVWLGGQSYYTCAREAVRLAMRSENLPRVKEVVNPDLYFIDTTYAVGPQECYDPRHPMTKQEDIHWKAVLSDYAREVFGLFGSECGREWAVPHADFFEGLASVSGKYFHNQDLQDLDGRVVPFFDMIFHDCISIYGKYGYEPTEMAEQVIHHIAMGRTLYYHSVGNHLYWKDADAYSEYPLPGSLLDPAIFTRAHHGWAEGFCLWDRFMKNTQEVLGPLNKRTSQAFIDNYEFLDHERLVRKTTFSNGVTTLVNGAQTEYATNSLEWGKVVLPSCGFLVEAGDFIAFLALAWNGHNYKAPVLFTMTSLDCKILQESNRVRVYHGFGSTALRWKGKLIRIRREKLISQNGKT